MTPYLVRSSIAHALIFAAVFLVFAGGAKKPTFYTIDFLGGSGAPSTSVGGPPAAAADTASSAALTPLSTKAAPSKPAPLPSLKRWLPAAKAATLKNAEMAIKSKNKSAPLAVEEPAMMGTSRKEPAPEGGAGSNGKGAPAGGGPGGGASVTTDLTNFPYQWYLDRLRNAIWSQWADRLPRGNYVSTLRFTIARSGSVSDIRVVEASGSKDFDFHAVTAINSAAPFPELPGDYPEETLGVVIKLQALP